MTDEPRGPQAAATKKEFSIVRKGYDPVEVEEHLAEYETAVRELEEYAARLKRELSDAKKEIVELEEAQGKSIDNAMLAVFATKDRIIAAAMEKAREIEEEARARAGLEPEAVRAEESPVLIAVAEDQQTPALEVEPELVAAETAATIRGSSVGTELLAELTELVGAEGEGAPEPNDVMQRMLDEAESIRNRLESGLSAAFEHMEKMQRDAEDRAAHLLAEARREATRLRSSGTNGPTIAVNLGEDGQDERPSRYSRNSAGLPRLGTEDGPSVLASMNTLRNKMREEGAEADSASS